MHCCIRSHARRQLVLTCFAVKTTRSRLTLSDLLRLRRSIVVSNTGESLDAGTSLTLDTAGHHLEAHHLNSNVAAGSQRIKTH